MTSEPYCPVPFDAHPYENRPLDKTPPQPPSADRRPPGLTAGGVSSSVPVDPAAQPPAGTLAFSEPPEARTETIPSPSPGERANASGSGDSLTFFCAVCLLEWDESFCSVCGAEHLPNIDRPSHPTIPGSVRGADRRAV